MLPHVNQIKIRRKNLGITQSQLADLTSISRTSLVKLETKNTDLAYSKIKNIFDKLEELETKQKLKIPLGKTELQDIQATPVYYIETSEEVHIVWSKMIEKEFSQMPVKEKSNIVGSITERTINNAIYELGLEKANSMKIKEIMDPPFPLLNIKTPINTVIPLLQHYQAILTTKNGEVMGIVTNSDIGKIFII